MPNNCWGCGAQSATPLCPVCVDKRLCHHKVLGICNLCYAEGLKTGHYAGGKNGENGENGKNGENGESDCTPDRTPDRTPHYGGGRRVPPVYSHRTRQELIRAGQIRPGGLRPEPVVFLHFSTNPDRIARLAARYCHARSKLRRDYRALFPVPDCLAEQWAAKERNS
jgi:hypothetical protein